MSLLNRRSFAHTRRTRILIAALASVSIAACSTQVAGTATPAPQGAGSSSFSTTDATDSTDQSSPSSETSDTSDTTDTSETGGASQTSVTQPSPKGLESFYSQQLEWGGCGEFAQTDADRGSYNAPGLQCARLRVPLNYDDLSKTGDVTIGVLRIKATGDKIGSLIFNPGGPGGSGMAIVANIVAYGAGKTLNNRFDLVGFDPRGIGASRPAIVCRTDAERDAFRAATDRPTTPEGIAAIDAQAERLALGCIDKTGKDSGIDSKAFLGSVGTRDVARDLDILRAALGDENLSYVGFSYGTRIGTAYAEQFPKNVRAMILDGAVDPTQDQAASNISQAEGFQKTFNAYAADCAKKGDCPLGGNPEQATAEFQKLTRPLLDKPIKLADGRLLTYGDAMTGTIQAMYAESLWPQLTDSLHQLKTGGGDGLMKLADSYEDRDSSGKYSRLLDAFTAVNCQDQPRMTAEQALQMAQKYYAAAPFIDSGDPVVALKSACDFWPAEPTGEPHTPNAPGLAPVLVISTTGDPATPYEAGVKLAEMLHGSLLTYEGNRHTAYLLSGISCVDAIGDEYLIDLKLPPAGTRC